MNKLMVIVPITFLLATGAGIAARLTLLPVKPAETEAATAEVGTGHAAPDSSAMHPVDEVAATTAPEGHENGPTERTESSPADVSPGPEAGVSSPGSRQKGEIKYTQLTQIISRMSPTEASLLLEHLDDAQVLEILRGMTINDAALVVASLPAGRATTIKARLLDPVLR
jgi:hypothetical protein